MVMNHRGNNFGVPSQVGGAGTHSPSLPHTRAAEPVRTNLSLQEYIAIDPNSVREDVSTFPLTGEVSGPQSATGRNWQSIM